MLNHRDWQLLCSVQIITKRLVEEHGRGAKRVCEAFDIRHRMITMTLRAAKISLSRQAEASDSNESRYVGTRCVAVDTIF